MQVRRRVVPGRARERGNRLGGLFGLDFSVLEEAHRTQVEHGDALTDWVQIVGHTVEVNEIRATRGPRCSMHRRRHDVWW